MIIKTAQGKEFPVVWAGKATIDNCLRFELISPNTAEVFTVFTDSKETRVIEHIFDDVTNQYIGYTEFMGLNMNGNNVIVALRERK